MQCALGLAATIQLTGYGCQLDGAEEHPGLIGFTSQSNRK